MAAGAAQAGIPGLALGPVTSSLRASVSPLVSRLHNIHAWLGVSVVIGVDGHRSSALSSAPGLGRTCWASFLGLSGVTSV